MCLYAKYNFLFFILIVIMTQTCSRCITHFMIYILIMMTDLTGPTPGRKWPQCDQSWLNTHPRGDQCQWCVSYDSNLQQKRPSVHKWIIPSLLLLVVVQYLIRKKKKKLMFLVSLIQNQIKVYAFLRHSLITHQRVW